MIGEQLLRELNAQMNYEFYSSHIYLAMAAYCAHENYDGFAHFFEVQADEERYHAMKIYRFINRLGRRAVIDGMETPNNDFKSLLDCFEQAYEHERQVTRRFYELSDIALNEREHATIHFLKWYIDEQVEEENLFDSLIHRLKRIENDKSALFMLDAELAQRTFETPED